jgi:hypothetical protein
LVLLWHDEIIDGVACRFGSRFQQQAGSGQRAAGSGQ